MKAGPGLPVQLEHAPGIARQSRRSPHNQNWQI
jgi:hypothetical protein